MSARRQAQNGYIDNLYATTIEALKKPMNLPSPSKFLHPGIRRAMYSALELSKDTPFSISKKGRFAGNVLAKRMKGRKYRASHPVELRTALVRLNPALQDHLWGSPATNSTFLLWTRVMIDVIRQPQEDKHVIALKNNKYQHLRALAQLIPVEYCNEHSHEVATKILLGAIKLIAHYMYCKKAEYDKMRPTIIPIPYTNHSQLTQAQNGSGVECTSSTPHTVVQQRSGYDIVSVTSPTLTASKKRAREQDPESSTAISAATQKPSKKARVDGGEQRQNDSTATRVRDLFGPDTSSSESDTSGSGDSQEDESSTKANAQTYERPYGRYTTEEPTTGTDSDERLCRLPETNSRPKASPTKQNVKNRRSAMPTGETESVNTTTQNHITNAAKAKSSQKPATSTKTAQESVRQYVAQAGNKDKSNSVDEQASPKTPDGKKKAHKIKNKTAVDKLDENKSTADEPQSRLKSKNMVKKSRKSDVATITGQSIEDSYAGDEEQATRKSKKTGSKSSKTKTTSTDSHSEPSEPTVADQQFPQKSKKKADKSNKNESTAMSAQPDGSGAAIADEQSVRKSKKKREKTGKDKSADADADADTKSGDSHTAGRAELAIRMSGASLVRSPQPGSNVMPAAPQRTSRSEALEDGEAASESSAPPSLSESESDGDDVGDDEEPSASVVAKPQYFVNKSGKLQKKPVLALDVYRTIVQQKDREINLKEKEMRHQDRENKRLRQENKGLRQENKHMAQVLQAAGIDTVGRTEIIERIMQGSTPAQALTTVRASLKRRE